MKLDEMLEAMVEKRLAERVEAVAERVIARMLGDEPKTEPVSVPTPATPASPRKPPAKRRAAARTGKRPTAPAKTRQEPAQRRGGPMPGRPADRILQALQAGPLTGGAFAEVLAGIDASDEAKRQAVTRLQKTGRLVVTQEKTGNLYRLGSTDARPTTGE